MNTFIFYFFITRRGKIRHTRMFIFEKLCIFYRFFDKFIIDNLIKKEKMYIKKYHINTKQNHH